MPIPAAIQQFIDRQADAAPVRYDDLRAVVFNGTLKRSPEPSQTDGLLAIARGLMERVGVRVDEVRTVDHEIPPGVWPDMKGFARRWALDHQFVPSMDPQVRKRKLKGWADAVRRNLTLPHRYEPGKSRRMLRCRTCKEQRA